MTRINLKGCKLLWCSSNFFNWWYI